ncbi:MAG: helix-turn-helix domain-containing protein, partial [Bacteroidales bacterium]
LNADDFIFRPTGRLSDSSFLTLEEMEKHMIEMALEKHNGRHTAVANQLGISRQTLYNKIKRYDL